MSVLDHASQSKGFPQLKPSGNFSIIIGFSRLTNSTICIVKKKNKKQKTEGVSLDANVSTEAFLPLYFGTCQCQLSAVLSDGDLALALSEAVARFISHFQICRMLS